MGNKSSGRRRNTTAAKDSDDRCRAQTGWNNKKKTSLSLSRCATINNPSSSVSQPHTVTNDDMDDQLTKDITIYRSYSHMATSELRPSSAGVSVYRSLQRGDNARVTWKDRPADVQRSRTLPSDAGRPTFDGTLHHRDTLPRSGVPGPRRQPLALDMLDTGWNDVDDDLRRVRVPAARLSSCRRSNYRVSEDDFPSTSCVRERLEQFETNFSRELVTLYTALTETVQLNTLSIAVKTDASQRRVSLWEYINCPDIAAELHRRSDRECDDTAATPGSPDFALTVSHDHFRSIMTARLDRKHVMQLIRQLVFGLARDAAAELARVYEYQLALLGDGLAGVMLAAHAACCVMDYVIGGGHYLEQDTVVMGAVKGQTRQMVGTRPIPVVSVIVGERELKWRLDEILTKPGLRLEIYFCSDDYQVRLREVQLEFVHQGHRVTVISAKSQSTRMEDNDDQLPWLFLTSPQHNAAVYGYRSIVLERHLYQISSAHDAVPAHRVCADDQTMFTTLTCPGPDEDDENGGGNFHRRYRPYQRLIAAANDGAVTAIEAAVSRFAADDVKLVHRRVIRKSSVGYVTTDTDL